MSPGIVMHRRPSCSTCSPRFVGVFMLVEIHDCDVRAFLGKGDGDRPPDPAVTPGDDGRLPLQFIGTPVLSASESGRGSISDS